MLCFRIVRVIVCPLAPPLNTKQKLIESNSIRLLQIKWAVLSLGKYRIQKKWQFFRLEFFLLFQNSADAIVNQFQWSSGRDKTNGIVYFLGFRGNLWRFIGLVFRHLRIEHRWSRLFFYSSLVLDCSTYKSRKCRNIPINMNRGTWLIYFNLKPNVCNIFTRIFPFEGCFLDFRTIFIQWFLFTVKILSYFTKNWRLIKNHNFT